MTARLERRSPQGFTLVEVLVVIGILAIVLAVGVPAFTSILYSSRRTLAENKVRAALRAAQDMAARSADADAAAVFFFVNGRCSVVTCVKAGEINDAVVGVTGSVRREVFAPTGLANPVDLPDGWSVRGYAASGMVSSPSSPSGWYEPLPTSRVYAAGRGTWVFPETNFFDPDSSSATQGRFRQTFMVRYKAGTGKLDVANRRPVLVVSPRSSVVGRPSVADAAADLWQRPDLAQDLPAWTRQTVSRPEFMLADAQKRRLVGDESTDTILTAPVEAFAVYDEQQLIGAIGGRGLNPATRTMYGYASDPRRSPTAPVIDRSLFGGLSLTQINDKADEWLEGRMPAGSADSRALLYVLDSYTGQPVEIKPQQQP